MSSGDDGSDGESKITCFFYNNKVRNDVGRIQLLIRNLSGSFCIAVLPSVLSDTKWFQCAATVMLVTNNSSVGVFMMQK